MKIHALLCGTIRVKHRHRAAPGTFSAARRFLDILRDDQWTDPVPIWAWAIEHPEGLLVVDTGEIAPACEAGFHHWTNRPIFRRSFRPEVAREDEIGPRLKRLGHDPREVRRVVLTHLHFDHSDGVGHFPNAEILVSDREIAYHRGLPKGANLHQWPKDTKPTPIDFPDGPYGPFPRSRVLTEAGDVVLVPTPGHTPGHLSVIVREWDETGAERAVFLAGDATFELAQLDGETIPGVNASTAATQATVEKIRAFARDEPPV